jgi:SAM-dependent methyltransferase
MYTEVTALKRRPGDCPPCFGENVWFKGTYFVYRHIDLIRVIAMAKAATANGRPSIVDVGCSNGNWTKRFLPHAGEVSIVGVDADRKFPATSWRRQTRVEEMNGERFDLAFVGWMDVDCDYRQAVSDLSGVIVTTFDDGGSCGVDGKVNYEEFGFVHVARWYTPAWYNCCMDLGSELTAKYGFSHSNCWDVYARPGKAERVQAALKQCYDNEWKWQFLHPYEHEEWLDTVGLTKGSGGRYYFWLIRFRDNIQDQIKALQDPTGVPE